MIYIKNFYKPFLLSKNMLAVVSIAVFLLSLSISLIIFDEGILSMLKYCLSFLLLSFLMSFMLENRNSDDDTPRNLNLVFIVLYSLAIIIFGISFYESWRADYFITNPIWFIDTYNKWHQDTAFNISLINGILNWGYPTIGIDGHRPTAYHVLSHYVDSALYLVSGLNPYKSYLFVSFIKACFFANAIFILCLKTNSSIKNGFLVFILSAPLIIASWHSIGSHALWFTSFLLIFTSGFAYRLISSQSKLSTKDGIKLFIVCSLLCAGKISTGFSFVCIIFAALFLTNIKNIRFYILGIICCGFIYLYQRLINYSYGIGSKIDISELTIQNYFNAMTSSNYAIAYLAILASLAILYFKTKDKTLARLMFGLVISHIVVSSITIIFTTFNINDRYYFFLVNFQSRYCF
ncbi:hypothetical protein OFY05_11340 [Pseudocitrobacter faecalis]|nr:hypothetical protein OFY05_11340 [Pseudocitrobacter faecalis]